nr:hypothetical protein [Pseudanabaena sp. UWO310]
MPLRVIAVMVVFTTETQTIVSIFNPRQNKWSEHFIWSDNGQKILGITAIGRATIERLDMNDERHDDGAIQSARRFWIRGGCHPPAHDPQQ